MGREDQLDVRAVAALLQRNPETVRRWIWAGRLPARREGNKLLVARADLDALPGARAGDGASLTLLRWAALAGEHRRDRRDAGTPRSSAADLVLVARGAAVTTPREP